jgi:hypothetical protein
MKSNFTRLLFGILTIAVFSDCSRSTFGDPDLDTGTWVSRPGFSAEGRSEASVFVVENESYISCGWDGVKRYNDLWRFDLSSTNGTWLQMASMPAYSDSGAGTARSSAVAFAVGQEGYVGTGYDGYNYLSDFWQYDVPSNSWRQIAPFPLGPRYEAVAFAIGNYGYVSTGYDGLNAQNDFWQYDPSQNLWTQKRSMGGEKRYSAVSFVYNNKGYIVTGVNSGTAVNDFWVFDPSQSDTSQWNQLRHITHFSTESYDASYTTIIRWDAAAFTILGTQTGDKAYITTGENGAFSSTTWEYDFVTDLWMERTPFEGGLRIGAIGFTIENRGFAGLGRNDSRNYADMWEFSP